MVGRLQRMRCESRRSVRCRTGIDGASDTPLLYAGHPGGERGKEVTLPHPFGERAEQVTDAVGVVADERAVSREHRVARTHLHEQPSHASMRQALSNISSTDPSRWMTREFSSVSTSRI